MARVAWDEDFQRDMNLDTCHLGWPHSSSAPELQRHPPPKLFLNDSTATELSPVLSPTQSKVHRGKCLSWKLAPQQMVTELQGHALLLPCSSFAASLPQ